MRVAICDDEAVYREETKKGILAYNSEIEIVEYKDGKELVQSQERFDLIFLDIEMPEMNGMEAAEIVREQKNDVPLVFLTSHDELVYDAFKVRAFRFLRKPVNCEEVQDVLQAVEKEIKQTEKIQIIQKGKVWERAVAFTIECNVLRILDTLHGCFLVFYRGIQRV